MTIAPLVLAPEPAATSQTGPGVQLLDDARRAAQEQDFSGVLEVTWSDATGEHNNDVFVRSVGGVLAGAAVRNLIGGDVLLKIPGGIEHGAGFEQSDVNAEVGEDLDGGAAAGARADDDHVERLGTTIDLQHPGSLYLNISPGCYNEVSHSS